MMFHRIAPYVVISGALFASTVQASDCNSNGVDDTMDISGSTSHDLNSNGIPDECDLKILSVFPGVADPDPIPADPTVAVGSAYTVSTVNRRILVQAKSGLALASSILNDNDPVQPAPGFFEDAGAGFSVYDPRCMFDQYTNRFVVIALDSSLGPGNGRLFIAVSKFEDPSDLSANGWYKLRMSTDLIVDNEVLVADFPGLGVDDKAIYITYFFEREGTEESVASLIRVINKAAILSGVKTLIEGRHYHDFYLPDRYIIQPAHTFGKASAEYFVTPKCAKSV